MRHESKGYNEALEPVARTDQRPLDRKHTQAPHARSIYEYLEKA